MRNDLVKELEKHFNAPDSKNKTIAPKEKQKKQEGQEIQDKEEKEFGDLLNSIHRKGIEDLYLAEANEILEWRLKPIARGVLSKIHKAVTSTKYYDKKEVNKKIDSIREKYRLARGEKNCLRQSELKRINENGPLIRIGWCLPAWKIHKIEESKFNNNYDIINFLIVSFVEFFYYAMSKSEEENTEKEQANLLHDLVNDIVVIYNENKEKISYIAHKTENNPDVNFLTILSYLFQKEDHIILRYFPCKRPKKLKCVGSSNYEYLTIKLKYYHDYPRLKYRPSRNPVLDAIHSYAKDHFLVDIYLDLFEHLIPKLNRDDIELLFTILEYMIIEMNNNYEILNVKRETCNALYLMGKTLRQGFASYQDRNKDKNIDLQKYWPYYNNFYL